jgi:hypothetical protein
MENIITLFKAFIEDWKTIKENMIEDKMGKKIMKKPCFYDFMIYLTENRKEETRWTKIGNLEWSEDLGEMDFFAAEKICKEMGGRLPDRSELISLFDNNFEEMQKMLGENPAGYYHWSATTTSSTTQLAWYVNLDSGNTHYSLKTSSASCRVRCVRKSN